MAFLTPGTEPPIRDNILTPIFESQYLCKYSHTVQQKLYIKIYLLSQIYASVFYIIGVKCDKKAEKTEKIRRYAVFSTAFSCGIFAGCASAGTGFFTSSTKSTNNAKIKTDSKNGTIQ